MGGVPYRSKGCNTCRRRKVKCDETRPECKRCLKYGYICTGYERKCVFIQHLTNDAKTLDQSPHEPTKGQTVKGERRDLVDAHHDIPRFDVNPAIRTGFVAKFIDVFAPPSTVRDGNLGDVIHLQDTFPAFIGCSPILDRAVCALSLALLSKRNGDSPLLLYSAELYGEALRMVHRRIQSGRKCDQDELFATVVFQLYELVNCSSLGFNAWLAHIQGSNAILAQGNSHCSSTITDHLFCRQLKFVTVCDAIGMRKSAYSYGPFWRNQPEVNSWREPIDTILDLVIECSALIEQTDNLIHHGNPSLQENICTGEKLLQSCLFIKDRLDLGFWEMQGKLGAPWSFPCRSPCWSELNDSILQSLLANPIEFPSLTCAESHLLYWATFILLYPLIDQLLIFLGWPRNNVPFKLWDVPSSESAMLMCSELPDHLIAVADHYASLICRSAKLLVRSEGNAMGAQILLAPLSQTAQFYRCIAASDKHRWCQAVFMQLAKLGFGIAPFLRDFVWPKYEAVTGKSTSITIRSRRRPSTGTIALVG
ncbi:hypothetical protein PHISCL_08585 [Aspergillus sclerotialis]|uniref:Zn(2)-C6 fungal-type domain-containing protein n=1 Tax=Aspergillus sclerotialis TaxID=2070753 RepID=A0A3A2ZCP7_9EURO|nr:hypothetical protein PHISCL_08585 [Aspergillus sclerotialis]